MWLWSSFGTKASSTSGWVLEEYLGKGSSLCQQKWGKKNERGLNFLFLPLKFSKNLEEFQYIIREDLWSLRCHSLKKKSTAHATACYELFMLSGNKDDVPELRGNGYHTVCHPDNIFSEISMFAFQQDNLKPHCEEVYWVGKNERVRILNKTACSFLALSNRKCENFENKKCNNDLVILHTQRQICRKYETEWHNLSFSSFAECLISVLKRG